MTRKELYENISRIGINEYDAPFVYEDIREVGRYNNFRLRDISKVFFDENPFGKVLVVCVLRLHEQNGWMSSWTEEKYRMSVQLFYTDSEK